MDLFSFAYLAIPQGFVLSGAGLRGSHLTLILFAAVMISRLTESKPLFWFTVYLCIQTALTLLAGVVGLVDMNTVGRAANLTIYHLAGVCFLYYVTKMETAKVFNIICIGAVVQAVIALSQYIGYDIVDILIGSNIELTKTIERDDLAGTLGNSNFCSAYLAISVPFFFRKNWNLVLFIILPVIFLSTSSTSIIALAVGLSTYNFWFIVPLLAVAGVYAAFFDTNIAKLASERRIHEDIPFVLNQILDKPLSIITGQGPGVKWQGVYPVHCEPLSFLLRHGVIGLVVAQYFILSLWKTTNETLRAAFAISSVCMLGTYSMTVAPTAILTLTIWGLILRGEK